MVPLNINMQSGRIKICRRPKGKGGIVQYFIISLNSSNFGGYKCKKYAAQHFILNFKEIVVQVSFPL